MAVAWVSPASSAVLSESWISSSVCISPPWAVGRGFGLTLQSLAKPCRWQRQHICTAWVRSNALGGYWGLFIAQWPWDPSVRVAYEGSGHPVGMWQSWGDSSGVQELLGVFQVVQVAGSSVDGGSAPTGLDSGGQLGPAEH